MSTTSATYVSPADTAKLLRAALKRDFPGVKFSVTSKRYAGGASINVSWVDGPRSADVDKVAQRYSGASFDGMVDLKSYHESWLRDADGEPQRVHFGADYVFCHRTISDEWRAGIFQLFSDLIGRELDPTDWSVWRQDVPLAVDRSSGELYRMVDSDTEDLSCVFHQFTGARQGGSLDKSVAVL